MDNRCELSERCAGLPYKAPRIKILIAEYANSVNPDEVAHMEPSHLDLHCLATLNVSNFPVL